MSNAGHFERHRTNFTIISHERRLNFSNRAIFKCKAVWELVLPHSHAGVRPTYQEHFKSVLVWLQNSDGQRDVSQNKPPCPGHDPILRMEDDGSQGGEVLTRKTTS